MRDPARIDRILAALGEYWKANPDMRLGQIVVTLVRSTSSSTHFFSAPEVFYIEDDRIETALGPLANTDLQAFYDTSKR